MEDRHRDNQRSKCYDWESSLEYRRDRIPYDQIQAIVDHVWSSEGLQHPPIVRPLPKQVTKHAADATRLHLRFPEETTTKIILHEIGHAMTTDFDGNGDSHGPYYVGTIMLLYSKYLGIPLGDMITSAREAKLKYVLGACSEF